MRWKPFIILGFLLSLELSSCSTEREVLIKSLPHDNSWFTEAKSIALTYGIGPHPVLGYTWSSKTIYISGERTSYKITYLPNIKVLILSKKHGSLGRAISYNEDEDRYYVRERDFVETIAERYLTKDEAEELAYNFFKELDRYGLR